MDTNWIKPIIVHPVSDQAEPTSLNMFTTTPTGHRVTSTNDIDDENKKLAQFLSSTKYTIQQTDPLTAMESSGTLTTKGTHVWTRGPGSEQQSTFFDSGTSPLTKIKFNHDSSSMATTQFSITPSLVDEDNMITIHGTSSKILPDKLQLGVDVPDQMTHKMAAATSAPPVINVTVESSTLTVGLPSRISDEPMRKQTRLTTVSSTSTEPTSSVVISSVQPVLSTLLNHSTTSKLNEYEEMTANLGSIIHSASSTLPQSNHTYHLKDSNSIEPTTKSVLSVTNSTSTSSFNATTEKPVSFTSSHIFGMPSVYTTTMHNSNKSTSFHDNMNNSTMKPTLNSTSQHFYNPNSTKSTDVAVSQYDFLVNKTSTTIIPPATTPTIADNKPTHQHASRPNATSTNRPVRLANSTHPQRTTAKPPHYRGTTHRIPTKLQTPKPASRRPSTKSADSEPQQASSTPIDHQLIDDWANQIHQVTSQRPYVAKRDCGIRSLNGREGRVVGGRDSQVGEFPWSVLIRETALLGWFEKTKCGGVLVDLRWVLTAAHCQPGRFGSLVVVVGELDLAGGRVGGSSNNIKLKPIVKRVKRMIVHRDYNPNNFDNDIALLELESPFQVQPHVVPICLPEKNEDFIGQSALVAGWGKLSFGGPVPSVLQVAKLPVIGNKQCQDMYQNSGHMKIISDSFLCAGYPNGGQDSCEGDSGGPLQVLRNSDNRWVLAGTVSHGIKCAEPNLPGIYIRTAAYLPWIKSIIHHQEHNKRYGHRLSSFSIEHQRSTPDDRYRLL